MDEGGDDRWREDEVALQRRKVRLGDQFCSHWLTTVEVFLPSQRMKCFMQSATVLNKSKINLFILFSSVLAEVWNNSKQILNYRAL